VLAVLLALQLPVHATHEGVQVVGLRALQDGVLRGVALRLPQGRLLPRLLPVAEGGRVREGAAVGVAGRVGRGAACALCWPGRLSPALRRQRLLLWLLLLLLLWLLLLLLLLLLLPSSPPLLSSSSLMLPPSSLMLPSPPTLAMSEAGLGSWQPRLPGRANLEMRAWGPPAEARMYCRKVNMTRGSYSNRKTSMASQVRVLAGNMVSAQLVRL